MAFSNLGFEAAGVSGTPGQALNWAISSVTTAVSLPVYDQGSLAFAYENFEGYWSSNESNVFAFSDPVTQLSSAQYSTTLPTTKFFEDFNELWAGNENYVFDNVLSESAGYVETPPNSGSGIFAGPEGFELMWLGISAFTTSITDGVNATAAVYGTGMLAYDAFEADWVAAYLTALGAVSAASYDTSPEAFEDCEEDWPTLVMTSM